VTPTVCSAVVSFLIVWSGLPWTGLIICFHFLNNNLHTCVSSHLVKLTCFIGWDADLSVHEFVFSLMPFRHTPTTDVSAYLSVQRCHYVDPNACKVEECTSLRIPLSHQTSFFSFSMLCVAMYFLLESSEVRHLLLQHSYS
jgi:hypothetical protein